ncbi:Peroxisomal membrane protein PMP27, partial [Ascosphaera atra]
GRDKVLRTIQYWSRFYSWYLLRTNKPQSTIAPWNTIKSQFSLTRKILRFGKNIEHIKAVAVALNSQPKADGDALLKYLTVGRQMGYATYLTFDMISYLHGSGIRKIKNFKEMADYAARAWFAGLLCSVLAGLYSIFRLAKREQAIDRKEGEGVVEAKKVQ